MSQPFVKGARCNVCGNGGPGSPGARYACGLPEVNRLIAGTGSKAICPFHEEPKETRTMTPENVVLAERGLRELGEIDTQIMCAKGTTLTVVIGGKYYDANYKDMQDAARVGILKHLYAVRSTKINELRGFGVELPE